MIITAIPNTDDMQKLTPAINNIIIHIGILEAKIKLIVTRRAMILLLPGLCDKVGNHIVIARAIIRDLNIARR